MIGSLIHEDYLNLYKNNQIKFDEFSINQIQPSSIDLSLSEECYEIKHSFLSPFTKVRDKLENLIIKKINLNSKFIFKINKTYIVKLNEKLDLKNNILGHCNPKSSTGRLDIFCRTIVDYSDEYEKIPKNYSGEIFLEITSRSFNIEFNKYDKLNQLRLVYQKHDYISDQDLENLNKKTKIIFHNSYQSNIKINNGLKVSVDLSKNNKIIAYAAKDNAPKLIFNKINYHKIENFWSPIKPNNKN